MGGTVNGRRNPDDEDPELRRLLSGMSDPGPAPDDLVARISRSLAEEERHQDGAPRRFDPATTPRPRRRVLATVGVLALTVGGVGTAIALHVDDETVTREAQRAWTVMRPSGAPASEAPVAAFADPGSAPPVAEDVPTTTADPLAGLTVLTSGTDYDRTRFAEQIVDLAEGREPAAGTVGDTPALPSRPEIARCLAGAGLQARQGILDVATYEGRPALVVLADRVTPAASSHGGEERAAVVLPATCGAASAHALAGPVDVH